MRWHRSNSGSVKGLGLGRHKCYLPEKVWLRCLLGINLLHQNSHYDIKHNISASPENKA